MRRTLAFTKTRYLSVPSTLLGAPLYPPHPVPSRPFFASPSRVPRQLGSITPGKWADFIIIDRDPWTVVMTALRTTQVLATYLDGEAVFCADDFCNKAPAMTPAARARIADRLADRAHWLRSTAGLRIVDSMDRQRDGFAFAPDSAVKCARPTVRAHRNL